MTDDAPPTRPDARLDALEQAYARGDHRTARRLARELLSQPEEPALVARAQRVLSDTEPDLFLAWVSALGLGLVAWLVYNYGQ